MKRKAVAGLIAIVVIATAVVFAGCIEETVTTPRYTLSEAIDKNFVKAEITGSGASSGKTMLQTVWRP